MSRRNDYYAALGVSKGASQERIKRAYRKLARKHHPDVNPGDAKSEERFKEISEAYHVLGDEERRAKYDQVGPEVFAQEFDLSDFAQQFGRFFRGGHGRGATGNFGMFEDLLGGLGSPFGSSSGRGGPRMTSPRAGRDISVQVHLSLPEAVNGVERTISFRRAGGGSGVERTRVRIPAGVRDGSKIRLRGKGEPGARGGPRGDLYLEVKVLPHPVFKWVGDDLHASVPVAVYEAALGSEITVPTLDGAATIRLPAGTRSGQRLRLTGKGAPDRGGRGRGDLLVTISIELPDTIDPELAEIFDQIRDRHPYDPRKGRGVKVK